jgi:Zn-finger nucleic acid-binding protein
MRTFERNGIVIDQCTECRGIFLDRGELERLIEAEDVHYGRAAAYSVPGSEDRYRDPGYPDPGYRGGHHGGGKDDRYGDPRRRRRGGFLGDLLDFG